MADFGTYYIDTDSFLTATAVFTDSLLTTRAPDGYYQACGVYRQQSSGYLLDPVDCAECSIDCSSLTSFTGEQGVYQVTIDIGTDLGVTIIRFSPGTIPAGIFITYNGATYSSGSSSQYGYLAGPYVGISANDCGLVAGSPHTLDKYSYNPTTALWTSATTEDITIAGGDVSLSAGNIGEFVVPVKRFLSSARELTIKVVAPCAGSSWGIEVECPDLLTGFSASAKYASSILACAAATPYTFYNVPVNGTPGTPGLYDIIYTDPFGKTTVASSRGLGAGWYKAGTSWIQIDSNSVVVDTDSCV